ncbi:MAG: hypothetical protein GX973_07140 [Firmicutes bacterium]|nr:hypothetical protein [Bacillota bacterium]
MGKKMDRRENWVFLRGVAGDAEAGVVESLLRAYQIPVLRKYREAGNFLKVCMGMTVLGIDLYVPAGYLEQAELLLSGRPGKDKDDP